MKYRPSIAFGLMLISTCVSGIQARDDARLKEKVEALYQKAGKALETKDLESYISLLAEDYQNIFAGRDREQSKNLLKDLFEAYDNLRVNNLFQGITRSGNWIRVLNDSKIEGKTRNKDWEVISQTTTLDLLSESGQSLKIARSAQIDKYRLANISGQTYQDTQTGFTFMVPKGWDIFPTSGHPMIKGNVIILAPDGTSAAMLGYVSVPGIKARQASEGDEALCKILSKPGTYRLIRSGPIRINGLEGFEIESEFFLPNDRERHRHRVYLNAGDLLYVLCFDAIPSREWDKVKDGFQYILNSVR